MGKGGSSTSVEIPAYIEDAAKKNLTRADKISALGSVPLSFGPTAAAFTPMQTSAFSNTADQAMSFGLNAPTGDAAMYGGMDAPTTYANGISAYSAAPLYNNIMDEFAAARPGQKDYIDSFFIDPFTGAAGYNVGNPIDYTTYTNTTTLAVAVVVAAAAVEATAATPGLLTTRVTLRRILAWTSTTPRATIIS